MIKRKTIVRRGEMRTARPAQRIVAAALSVVLTVGMLPSLSWADDASTSDAAGAAAAEVVDATEASAGAAQEQASNGIEVVEIGGAQAEAAGTEATDAAATEAAEAEEEALEAEAVLEPLANETVTVGTGASKWYTAPYSNNTKYSGVQMLYTASEIGKVGKITKLAFNVGTASSFDITDFKVYLGVTDQTGFTTSTALTETDLTLVYSRDSQTIGASAGWEEIALDTQYSYDGTKNLVVAIYRKASSTNSSLRYCYSSNSAKVLYRASSYTEAYGEISGTNSYSTSAYRPNIQLTINTCAHENLTEHPAVAPACGTGNIEYWSCDACGNLFSDAEGKVSITSTKAEHSWNAGEVTTAANCKEDGVKTYTCSVCNGTKTEVIPATKEHHFVNGFCDNILRDGKTVCNAEDKWDGETCDEPSQVDGVYQIKTGEELAWFMNEAKANKYAGKAILTRDINMGTLTSWYLPGGSSSTNGFQGELDGNGYAITMNYDASTSNAALFGYVGTNGAIKNLTIKGSFTGKFAAGFAIYNYGTIQNCKNEAAVTATSSSTNYAGGFVAYNYGAVKQCVNKGAVSATTTGSYNSATAGGIVGYSSSISGVSYILSDCYNTGTVSAKKNNTYSSAYARSGGITGYIPYSASAPGYTLENCLNAGVVSASNSDESNTSNAQANGIAGAIGYGSSYSGDSYSGNVKLTNCFYLEGTANASYVSTTADKEPATATNCGSTTTANIANAGWLISNLDEWFIDLLGVQGTKYPVTFTVSNATVKVKDVAVTEPLQTYEGAQIKFTVTPDEGYAIDSVKQGDTVLTAVDDIYTTAAIAGATTITIATHQHAWDNGTIDPEPTCTVKGVKTFKCTVSGCTATKTEDVAATGVHTFESAASATAKVEPTCTATGTEAYWTCDVCKQLFSDAEGKKLIEGQKPVSIPALGHDYTKYRDNGNGTHTLTCSRCNADKPAGYDVSTTGSTTMTAGKTYVIAIDGYALSCEDAASPTTYWRYAVAFTAGQTTVDSTLLWIWGENGSLKNVSTGQYLTNSENYKLIMSDTPSTVWKLDENGQIYCVNSSNKTCHLYCFNNSIYPHQNNTPDSEAFYEATAIETAEAHDYGTDESADKCTKCGAEKIAIFDKVTYDESDAFVSVATTSETGTTASPLYLVTAKASYLKEGYVPVIGETAFVKDGDTYKALVSKEEIDAIDAGTSRVWAALGTAKTMPELKGDVNASGTLNIVDAQVAYDMSCARYAETTLPLANFLAADVNGIDGVNATDAFAIQHALLFGWSTDDTDAGDTVAA